MGSVGVIDRAAAPDVRRLAGLPLDGLPDGLAARLHKRSDLFTGHVWHRVQVYPVTVDPDTRQPFGPGAVAEIEWRDEDSGFLVYVSGGSTGCYVQSCGMARVFDAAGAVQHATWEVTWEVARQARGW